MSEARSLFLLSQQFQQLRGVDDPADEGPCLRFVGRSAAR